MDIKAITDQVMGAVGNSPEALKDLIADPQAAISDFTGVELEGADLTGVVDQVKENIAGGGLDLGSLGENLPGGIGDILGGIGGLFGRK